jgi:hypothetical protein
MMPDGSPLAVLAQQGAEAANFIITEKSIGVPQREPSVGGNDRVSRARSEAVSSACSNRRLSEHDVWRHADLSDRNLSFAVKIPIRCHKVAKTLIDSGASLNLMMRNTFIKMGLNLADLTPVHDTFYGIISGQSSTPIGCIKLEVPCGTGENKHRDMLTFEVASFDIGYNYILGRSFLLKFMMVIHTAYATIKIPGPKGIIVLKSDQRDALACENATLTHDERFGEKEAHELAAKVAKAHGGSTPIRTAAPKSPAVGTHWSPAEKKSTFMGSMSNQPIADQPADDKKKGAADKDVAVDPDDMNKKLRFGTELEAK